MKPLLEGQRLTEVRLQTVPNARLLDGSLVEALEPLGKNFLLTLQPARDLGGRMVVRVHLGMNGSWHQYRRGERWRGPARNARAVLKTDRHEFVCFEPKDVELFALKDLPLAMAHLGPDLLGPDPDLDEVTRRALQTPERPLADILLDQRVAAGLGNVYKSELCFLGPAEDDRFWEPRRGLYPWKPIGALSAGEVRGLFRRGRDALRANLGGWPRTTTWDRRRFPRKSGPIHWVYGMSGRPCMVCGTRIQRRVWGAEARVTCWCPACQPEDSVL